MEIGPGIHKVDGVNGNCYVVELKNLIVIDTGMPGSGRKILSYIKTQCNSSRMKSEQFF